MDNIVYTPQDSTVYYALQRQPSNYVLYEEDIWWAKNNTEDSPSNKNFRRFLELAFR